MSDARTGLLPPAVPRVPTWYLSNIDDCVQRHGVPAGTLFAAAGIDPALVAAGGWIDLPRFTALIQAAGELSGAPGFALEAGGSMTPASHGSLGIAVLTSATLREAVRVLTRYLRTRTPLVHVDARIDGDDLRIDVTAALAPEAIHQPLMELIVSTMINALRALTAGRFRPRAVQFDFPEPAHAGLYARYLHTAPRFDAAVTAVRVPVAQLDLPLPLADRVAWRAACEQCERELQDLDRRTDIRDRVRARLLRETTPDCAGVADDLGMSERTLRRRLAGAGASFQAILNEARRERAEYWLAHTRMGIAEIADRLGYSDPSNFGHAFRQWTGLSPRAWRRRAGHAGNDW